MEMEAMTSHIAASKFPFITFLTDSTKPAKLKPCISRLHDRAAALLLLDCTLCV